MVLRILEIGKDLVSVPPWMVPLCIHNIGFFSQNVLRSIWCLNVSKYFILMKLRLEDNQGLSLSLGVADNLEN